MPGDSFMMMVDDGVAAIEGGRTEEEEPEGSGMDGMVGVVWRRARVSVSNGEHLT